jgi:CheY-like chemotaxis protein
MVRERTRSGRSLLCDTASEEYQLSVGNKLSDSINGRTHKCTNGRTGSITNRGAILVQNTTFLYVEDDPRSREVMNLLMTKAMRVKNLIIFEDSANFDSRLKELDQRPDVFLLDIHVLPYDGFGMLDMIRRNPELKDAKVIALTASVMNEEVDAMQARGFDGAIGKPLSISTFPALIERVVKNEAVWHIV